MPRSRLASSLVLVVVSLVQRPGAATEPQPQPPQRCELAGPGAGGAACPSLGAGGGPGLTSSRDHALLAVSHRLATSRTGVESSAAEGAGEGEEGAEAAGCTPRDGDPWHRGRYRPCCADLRKRLGELSPGRWQYRCLPDTTTTLAATPSPGGCTPADSDPYRDGTYAECCSGLQKELGHWSADDYSYRCRPRAEADITPPHGEVPGRSGPSKTISFKVLEWNVYYKNKDTARIAKTILERWPPPDIIGLCELTAPVDDMAQALSTASGRRFEAQPGRGGGWRGYGADIFFDSGRWKALEGGALTTNCESRNGHRAANWAVLEERKSGSVLITGGTHLSSCPQGCDLLHECELVSLYTRLGAMKKKYPGAPVVWMGDLNLNRSSRVVRLLLEGRVGELAAFAVKEVAQTTRSTHISGGRAIDHIFGERHSVQQKFGKHGSTGQGITGRMLGGADHYPIYSVLRIAR